MYKKLRKHFKCKPVSLSIATHEPLERQMAKIDLNAVLADFSSGKHYVEVLTEYGIGVLNYRFFLHVRERLSKDKSLFQTATLEECLIYLTILWREDYSSGGYGDFDLEHADEISAARTRIVNILSCKEDVSKVSWLRKIFK